MDLPTEIIQNIFLELCPPQTRFPLRLNEIRVLLTHVSSQWRAVALAMPELWANILIYIDYHCQPNFSHLFNLINVWISCSGQSMLSFESTGAYNYDSSSVFDLILPHMHRCSSLSLHCLETPTLHRLLSNSPSLLSSLQTIKIEGKIAHPLVTSPGEGLHITALQSCPQLRHVTFLLYGRDIDAARFNLPWHQLISLEFANFTSSADSLLGVLGKCTRLEYCTININISRLTLQNILSLAHRPITLSSVHHLSLSFFGSSGIHDCDSHFLAALRCPRLRKLALSSRNPSPLSLSSLQLFYGASSETLENLDLCDLECYCYLAETLYLLPHLKTLRYFDSSSLFLGVAQRLGEGTIAPRLTTLVLHGIEIDDVLDVVEARMKAARVDPNIAAFIDISVDRLYNGLVDDARVAALEETGIEIEIGN